MKSIVRKGITFNMETENVVENEKAEIINVEYERPKLFHRVLANFIDILLMVGVTILAFIASRAIVQSTDMYRTNDYRVREIQLSSGLYINADRTNGSAIDTKGFDINEYQYGDSIQLMTYWLPRQSKLTYEDVIKRCEKTIDKFTNYMAGIDPKYQDEITTFVNEKKLAKVGKVAGHEHFFEKNNETNEIFIPTNESGIPYYSYQTYFKEFYKLIMDDNLVDDYLTKGTPKFKEYMSNEGKYLLFIEFPSAYLTAAILVYFIPPLFFRRGRQTLGKALYRIGLVDKNIFSPTLPRYLARFAIFFFAELVLSLVTFGAPYIISFSMMLLTKDKQGFPDYLLRLNEVDTSKQKIYYNKIDALSDKASIYKAPTDFKLPDSY